MLMGKGGVGKTTIAAAIAVELAERGYAVHLTTTDPASHLTQTLAASVANLTVSRIDPAEATPVLEAAGLQDDLRRAGIEPWAWVINASLAAASTSHPLLRPRAAAELPEIARVQAGLANRHAVVAMQATNPVGAAPLRALCAPAPVVAAA